MPAAIDGGSPELTDDRLAAVTFYGRTLAVPAMRDVEDDAVQEGSRLFEDFGCTACHTPTLTTGESDIAALADQEIHPYTDLLLHDMGPGLADGRPDFAATGSEWRTPPLWGLGVVDDVNGERFLLHDGRAATFDEAILWHGGEAAAAAEAFRTAPARRPRPPGRLPRGVVTAGWRVLGWSVVAAVIVAGCGGGGPSRAEVMGAYGRGGGDPQVRGPCRLRRCRRGHDRRRVCAAPDGVGGGGRGRRRRRRPGALARRRRLTGPVR